MYKVYEMSHAARPRVSSTPLHHERCKTFRVGVCDLNNGPYKHVHNELEKACFAKAQDIKESLREEIAQIFSHLLGHLERARRPRNGQEHEARARRDAHRQLLSDSMERLRRVQGLLVESGVHFGE